MSAALNRRAEPCELTLRRIFDAPRHLVFAAWIDRRQLVQWWGPRGFTIVSSQHDVRPGGVWRLHQRSPEGKDHWLGGNYREIAVPERIAFTFSWLEADGTPKHETLVTVTFVARGDKTEVTVHQAPFDSVASRDDHSSGWSSSFELLGEFLARR